jgi:hypothetical protein
MRKVDEIFVEKIAHKGTLTNLFGLSKTIEKKEEMLLPKMDNEVQTTMMVVNVHSQTDEGTIGGDHHYYTKSRIESPGFRPSSGAPKQRGPPFKRTQTIKNYDNNDQSSPKIRKNKKDASIADSTSSKQRKETSKSKSIHDISIE